VSKKTEKKCNPDNCMFTVYVEDNKQFNPCDLCNLDLLVEHEKLNLGRALFGVGYEIVEDLSSNSFFSFIIKAKRSSSS
jgi:hypothetical protein